MNGARMHYCQDCKSRLDSTKAAKDEIKRLATNFALRMGFTWRYMTGGFLSKAIAATRRALKYAKRAHCSGCASIAGRRSKDKRHAGRMDLNDVSAGRMQEWDAFYAKRGKHRCQSIASPTTRGNGRMPDATQIYACWWTTLSAASLELPGAEL